MAKITSVNNTPATGAEAMFIFKATMKSAGWSVPLSNDGISAGPFVGDLITIPGTGTGGMENLNAWFVLRNPAGDREWSFQFRINTSWRIKYSALDLFTVGAATGQTPTTPSAPPVGDEQILLGGGTDVAPTGGTLFAANASYRWHVIAQDVGTGPSDNKVYGFWAFATEAGSGDLETVLMQEPINPNSFPALVGTRAAPTTGDPDPLITIVQFNAGAGHMRTTAGTTRGWCETAGTNNKRCWFQYNNTNNGAEAFVQIQGSNLAGDSSPITTHLPRRMGTNPYDGSDEVFPIYCGRPDIGYTAQIGSKGVTAFIKQKGTIREYPGVINLDTDAFVYLEDCLVPWEDGTLPIV